MSQGSPRSQNTDRAPGNPSVPSPEPNPDAIPLEPLDAAEVSRRLRSVAPPPPWGPRDAGRRTDGQAGPAHGSERLFGAAPPRHETKSSAPTRGVKAALRALLRERRRLALAVVAVALGIGYLAGALSLLNRVGTGLALQAGASDERADIVVEGLVATSTPLQEVRRLVANALLEPISRIDGVAAAEARLESKSTVIFSPSGERIVGLGLTERPLGGNFPTDDEMNPYRFVGEGEAPDAPDEVAIDSRSARVGGISVGDVVEIAGKSSIASYRVTGIVEPIAGELPEGTSLALFEEETARALFDLGADDNAIAIRVEESADVDEVMERVAALVGPNAEVVDGATYAMHRRASFEQSFMLIRALLVGFAGLALVVGSFTVANTMSLLFDHRRRGFAMLRLMGASPGQLRLAATGEALIGGAIAGVVGLGLGLGLGFVIERAIGATGTAIPTAGGALTWWIPLASIGIGMAITVATALGPAREASRTPPVVAASGRDPRDDDASRLGVVGRALRLLAAAAVSGAVLGWILAGPLVAVIGAGVAVGLTLVLVVLPRILGRLVGAATSLMLGGSVALRRMSALRSRQARTRAASTTGALLLATTVVSGLVVIGQSFVASVEGEIDDVVTADLVLDSQTFTNGGFDSEVIPSIRRVPGVKSATAWSVGSATIGSRAYRIGGVTGQALLDSLALRFRDGTPDEFGATDVIVSETLATREGYATGQQIVVSLESAPPMSLRIVGIYDSPLAALIGDALIDHDTLHRAIPQSQEILGFVRFDDDAPADVEDEVRAVAERFRVPAVLKPDELVGERAEYLSGFSRVIQWMLAFSVVLALVGVANTLQLGVNERRREIGLLRSVGATRAQVLRLVLTEAAALSIVGSVIGSLVGVGIAVGAVGFLRDLGMTTLVLPWPTIVGITLGALVLSLLCAVPPSIAAVGIPPLDAIAESEQRSLHRRVRRRASAPRTTPVGDAPGAATVVPGGTPAGPTATGRTGAPVEPNVARPRVQPPVEARVIQGDNSVRCFACGSNPGGSETCPVCGADLRPGSTLVGSVPTDPTALDDAFVEPVPPGFDRAEFERAGFERAQYADANLDEATDPTVAATTETPADAPVTATVLGTEVEITDAEVVDDPETGDFGEPIGGATFEDASTVIDPAIAAAAAAAESPFVSAPDEPMPEPPRSAKFRPRDAEAGERTSPFRPDPSTDPLEEIPAGVDDALDDILDDMDGSEAERPGPQPTAPVGGMFSAGPESPAPAPPAPASPSSTSGRGASAVPPAYARSAESGADGETEPAPAAPPYATPPYAPPYATPYAPPYATPMPPAAPTAAAPPPGWTPPAGGAWADPAAAPRWGGAAPFAPSGANPVSVNPVGTDPIAASPVDVGAEQGGSRHVDPAGADAVGDDPHGIAGAVARLGAESRIAGSVSFKIAAVLLDSGERVDGLAVGRSLGMVTTLVATPRRLLIISERGFDPEIIRISWEDDIQIHDRSANGFASITIIGSGTVVTVDQIRDVEEALRLAATMRERLAG